MTTTTAREDRLYARAWAIREGNANGLWVPIIQHLALRGYEDAMLLLADWYSCGSSLSDCGSFAHASSGAGLYRRAWRRGSQHAAQNLAMDHFNRNDLAGYRHWLRKAARAGDTDAATELGHFETRLPHGNARRIRRLRPHRVRERA